MAAKRPSLAESMNRVQQAPAKPVSTKLVAAVRDEEGRAGKRYHAATRQGMKRLTAPVPPEEHRRLKRLAADTGRSIEELMREAIADLFAKHKA